MSDQKYTSVLKEQMKSKPQIEDVINNIITDNTVRTSALDFVENLRKNKLNPVWAGFTNAWKIINKGKPLCYIRLNGNSDCMEHTWVITPYLDHVLSYEDTIVNEELHTIVFNNLFYCKRCFAEKYPEGRPCVGGRDITLLKKEIKGVCVGRQPVWFYDPDKTTIYCIKRLIDLEKTARSESIKK